MDESLNTGMTNQLEKDAPMSSHVQSLYDKAQESLRLDSKEYAIEILFNALEFAPDNRDIRRQLRKIELEVFNTASNKTKIIVMAVLKHLGDFVGLHVAQAKKNPVKGAECCEAILKRWPENITVLKALAGFLNKSGYVYSVIDAYELIKRIKPSDIDNLRALASVYESMGEMTKAINCYDLLLKQKPGDMEAERHYKNLIAKNTMKVGKWEESDDYRDKIKDKDEATILEQEQRVSTTGDGAELLAYHEAQLAKNPDNMDMIRRMADMYLKYDEFDKSVAMYERALEVNPKDSYISRMMLSVKSKKYDHQITELEIALKDGLVGQSAEKDIEKLRTEKAELELDGYAKLVDQYPTDIGLKYKYGCLLKDVGKLDDAIGMFQKSILSPDVAFDAYMKLAQCFYEKEMYDLALEFYSKANEKIASYAESDEPKKEVNYQMGLVFEALGKKDKALEKFRQIYSVDIDFKDVRNRI